VTISLAPGLVSRTRSTQRLERQRVFIRTMFAEEYGRQMKVLGSSGLVGLSRLLIWKRNVEEIILARRLVERMLQGTQLTIYIGDE
jgi:hypothetical protein